MQIACTAVGKDFKDFTGNDDLIGSEHRKLQKLERWFQKMAIGGYASHCKHVWITLTGFCWMLLGSSGHTHSQTHLLPFTKCLTMKLAVYLAKEIAAILRAVLIQRARSCTITVWCTCFAPITGYNNATREGERKRPGPSGVTPAATTEGEKLSCRQPILDGPGSGSCGHSQAMVGGTGKPMCADYRDGSWESRC